MTILNATDIAVIDTSEMAPRIAQARGPDELMAIARDYMAHRISHLDIDRSTAATIVQAAVKAPGSEPSPGLDIAARIARVGSEVLRVRGPEALRAYWMWALGAMPIDPAIDQVPSPMAALLAATREGDRPRAALLQQAQAQIAQADAYEQQHQALFAELPAAYRERLYVTACDARAAFEAGDGCTYVQRSVRWRLRVRQLHERAKQLGLLEAAA